MKKLNSIEKRILNLEKKISVPGTMICRCYNSTGKLLWSLAIGKMAMPKEFFYGETIEICLDKAESKLCKS